jgi:hypothetical protein
LADNVLNFSRGSASPGAFEFSGRSVSYLLYRRYRNAGLAREMNGGRDGFSFWISAFTDSAGVARAVSPSLALAASTAGGLSIMRDDGRFLEQFDWCGGRLENRWGAADGMSDGAGDGAAVIATGVGAGARAADGFFAAMGFAGPGTAGVCSSIGSSVDTGG